MTSTLDRVSNFCSGVRSWVAAAKQSAPLPVTYAVVSALGLASAYFACKAVEYGQQVRVKENELKAALLKERQSDVRPNTTLPSIPTLVANELTKDVDSDDTTSLAGLYQNRYLPSIANAVILALISIGIYWA
jgi:hypothetical protein